MPKLIIEPTEQFFMAGDVMVRAWTGTDQDGSPVTALVAGVYMVETSALGLREIPPPSPEDQRRWAEKIMNG
jgi:hypothetical protein